MKRWKGLHIAIGLYPFAWKFGWELNRWNSFQEIYFYLGPIDIKMGR